MPDACPTRERGHNCDSRGAVCFRCLRHPPESIAAPTRSEISETGAAAGAPGPDATTTRKERLL